MALIFAAALLALAVVLYVISPILQGQHAPLTEEGDELEDARARKKVALRALRDAEFDFSAGKLDQADYESLKAELSAEALTAIAAADALEPGTGVEADAPPSTDSTSDGAAVAPSADEAAMAPSADVEDRIARVRQGLRSGTTCGHCGQVNREGSNFCTSCGRPLERPVPVKTGG
jgi:hypothetical protein